MIPLPPLLLFLRASLSTRVLVLLLPPLLQHVCSSGKAWLTHDRRGGGEGHVAILLHIPAAPLTTIDFLRSHRAHRLVAIITTLEGTGRGREGGRCEFTPSEIVSNARASSIY